MFTRKVYVQHVSLTDLQSSGYELGDNDTYEEEMYSRFGELSLISRLTNKQRKVVDLLSKGYKRKEIAKTLGVSLQAIHQIVPRIRKRVKKHVSI
jgi:DNA-binding NarL/FixJ family response regulator